ncbi:MAG: IgGFc-binding protein [Sorangiineae bacterium]|nr:IgGFc-binding protein [Polyangiaceae bacterium]MEB2322822.1 IgGFc-binding protein [Sorangiineae bacterium]
MTSLPHTSYRWLGSFPVLACGALLAACSSATGGNALGTGGSPGTGGSSGTGGFPGTGSSPGTGGSGFDAGAGTGGGKGGGVPQTCAQALEQQSYIGCEYWPTVTSNSSVDNNFQFAITVANPTAAPADVRVERAGQQVAQASVAPGQLQTMTLPWVPQLKQQSSAMTSVLLAGGGYKISSTVPITLYQFNPLEFQIAPAPPSCDKNGTDGCYSFTNDASLMLPTTALRKEYFVVTYPTFHIGQSLLGSTTWGDAPGFVAITATQPNTTVQFTSSSHVRAGTGVQAMTPGQVQTLTLQNAGDVVMIGSGKLPPQRTDEPNKPCATQNNGGVNVIMCPTPKEYDLTGSFISASAPVSVVAGHDCTFIPFSRFACDHIEESMFPVEALGKDLVVTAPANVAAAKSGGQTPDNMFVRVLSAADDNKIVFDPAVHGEVTLNKGQWIEIGPVTQDFHVKAQDKILVAQFMVGENFSGSSAGAGDPSESVAIPTEQYRLSYTFLAPTTYTYNLVNVVAPPGATINIDGQPIPASEFTPIGSSGLSVARHKIPGGAHQMTGSANFGIVVYGYGSYTSYMYPGGLNLETIVIDPR